MTVKWVPLGNVLTIAQNPEPVVPESMYDMLGVRSFARGAFAAAPLAGAGTAYKFLHRLASQQVVYPKLMAWEGAFAVVPEELDGRYVSPEFQCFDVDDSRASVRYLAHVLAWPGFTESVRQGSTGTNARRRRLQPSAFMAIRIPLPPRLEQDRIAAHLDSLSAVGTSRNQAVPDPLQAVADLQRVPLRDLVMSAPRSVAVDGDAVYELSGVKWYGQGLFVRERKFGRELSSKTLRAIRSGDLVYNRLFAWKQSFALAEEDGYASSEFPTFEVNVDRVSPKVLLAALLTAEFTDQVNHASTGSTPTSRNRLKEKDFLSLEVQIPDRAQQPAVERALVTVDRIRQYVDQRDVIASALLPAARNEIFAAMA